MLPTPETKPDFVYGDLSFYKDKLLTRDARARGLVGKPIKADCFLVKKREQFLWYVLVDDKGIIIYDTPRLKDMGCHINILRLQKGFGNVKR